MDFAHVSDVEAWRGVAQRPTIASRRVWGPVHEHAAARVGSAFGAESVCIAPQLSPFLLAAALECIPIGVLPRKADTAETLAERLCDTTFLDDAQSRRS